MKPAAAWILFTAAALAQTGFLDRSITVGREVFRYQVYVPAEHSSASLWPVIVYLHGNGAQGRDGLRQTKGALADAIRQNRSSFPGVVVFPQAQPGIRWHVPEMEDLVMAELERTIGDFHGDRSRVYLTGFSMGGSGAYRIACRWPQRFAALVAVAGRVEPGSNYTAEEVAIDRRTNPFVTAPNPFAALALGIKEIPVRIFHGAKDETVSVEQSRRLAQALKDVGANVSYTEYPDANHVEAAVEAFADTELIVWMFRQSRPAR